MNKNMIVDALSGINESYLEDHVLYEDSLYTSRRKRKTLQRALLISAACIAMCIAMLLVGLPVAYIMFPQEMDQMIFPLEQEAVKKNTFKINWEKWGITNAVFEILNAGEQNSVIEQMQNTSDDSFFGSIVSSSGNMLDRMYDYYAKYKDKEYHPIPPEETTETVPHHVCPVPDEEYDAQYMGFQLIIHNNTEVPYYEIIGYEKTQESNSDVLEIPSHYNEIPITVIGNNAFSRSNIVSTIIVPNTVTIIGDSAFEYNSMTSIILGDGLEKIGNNAFRYCENLKKITIPNTVTVICQSAFEECSALEELVFQNIPDEEYSQDLPKLEIMSSAFKSCVSLESLVLPNRIVSVHKEAFYQCFELKSITLSTQYSEYYTYGFYYAPDLADLYIPYPAAYFEKNAVFSCLKLKTVHFSGTMQQWEKISEGISLSSGAKIICTDGEIEVP